jgi:hypothetical protein
MMMNAQVASLLPAQYFRFRKTILLIINNVASIQTGRSCFILVSSTTELEAVWLSNAAADSSMSKNSSSFTLRAFTGVWSVRDMNNNTRQDTTLKIEPLSAWMEQRQKWELLHSFCDCCYHLRFQNQRPFSCRHYDCCCCCCQRRQSQEFLNALLND